MTDLDKIIDLINQKLIFTADMFSNVDLDSILDKRDEDPFDSDWTNALEDISKKSSVINQDDFSKIETIRELAFKAAGELSEFGEISGYISDDFEMISKAVAVRSDNLWVSALLKKYLRNEIPYEALDVQCELINDLL